MSCCDNEIPIGRPAANERVDLSQSLLFCMTESLGVAEFRQLHFEFILSLECVILSCDLQSLCRIVWFSKKATLRIYLTAKDLLDVEVAVFFNEYTLN